MLRDLITAEELAERLGIAVATIRDWCSQGRIPFYRVGGRAVRFDPEEIETWLESQHVQPAGRS